MKTKMMAIFCGSLRSGWMAVSVAIIFLVLASCGPTHDLRRASKLMKRAVDHGAKIVPDTVFTERQIKVKGDTAKIIIPSYTQYLTKLKDTVIYQDRIKIHYQYQHDTLRETIQCPDSVIKWKERTAINNQIICPPADHTWRTVALTLGGIFLLLLLALVVGRVMKL